VDAVSIFSALIRLLNLSPFLFLTVGCAVADGIFLYSCGDKEVVQYDPDNPDEGECFLSVNALTETENT
jgi:hypothetical protein